MLGSAPSHVKIACLGSPDDGEVAVRLNDLLQQLELRARGVLKLVGHDESIGVLHQA